MKIKKSALILALHTAIKDEEAFENRLGYKSDGPTLAAWREMKKAVESGQRLDFDEDETANS